MSPRVAAEDRQHEGGTRWVFELDLHPRQREVFEHPARFKVIAAGRRFGKTVLCAALCIIVAASKPDANVMWVAPAHRQAKMAMRLVKKFLPKGSYEANNTTQEIFLATGGRIAFVSGDRPDNLRGEGLDLVVVDEAAFIEQRVWTQAIRPALSDRLGKAVLISTFDGENWYFDLETFAEDPKNVEWMGWRFPTAANPYIDPAEIEEARRNLPAEVFAQEYEASPLSYSGAVFRAARLNHAAELGDELTVPTEHLVRVVDGMKVIAPGPSCEAGLDWGWNVTALEVNAQLTDGRIAWVAELVQERIELTERCENIADVCEQWGVQCVYADAADPTANAALAMTFDRRGLKTEVQPVPFNVWKKAGISARNYHLEREREVITPACRQLLIDSKAYHYEEDGEKPAKGKDHTVDAATAFYASRAYLLGAEIDAEEAS